MVNWLWEVPVLPERRRGVDGRAARRLADQRHHAVAERLPVQRLHQRAVPGRRLQRGRREQRSARTCRRSASKLPDTSQEAYINGLFTAADFPRPTVLGTLPRNAYRGPRLASTDLSFFKDFQLSSARTKLQFRAEAFNVFNRVNLQRPQRQPRAGHLRPVDAVVPGA